MSRQEFQKSLNKVMEYEADLKTIEAQINILQENYLRTWTKGNIIVGWKPNKNIKPTIHHKIFSLSSVTSMSTKDLQEGLNNQYIPSNSLGGMGRQQDSKIAQNYLLRKRK